MASIKTKPKVVDFLTNIDKYEIVYDSLSSMKVTIKANGESVYEEDIIKTDGVFRVERICDILEPYFGDNLSVDYEIVTNSGDSTLNFKGYAIYATCEVDNFTDVANKMYLTKRDRVNTSEGHKEVLGMWFYGKQEKLSVLCSSPVVAEDKTSLSLSMYLNHAEQSEVLCFFDLKFKKASNAVLAVKTGYVAHFKSSRECAMTIDTTDISSMDINHVDVIITGLIHATPLDIITEWGMPSVDFSFVWCGGSWKRSTFAAALAEDWEECLEKNQPDPNNERLEMLSLSDFEKKELYADDDYYATLSEADVEFEEEGYVVSDEDFEPFDMSTRILAYDISGNVYDVSGNQSIVKEVVGGSEDCGIFKYLLMDVSPSNFSVGGVEVIRYNITNKERSIIYILDHVRTAPNPIIMFKNSYGVPEFLYCNGMKESDAQYERDGAMIKGRFKNYRVKETRFFNADTGVLDEDEVEFFLDMMRSDEVYECKMGTDGYTKWKEIAITESECKYTNEDDNLPRYSFTYRISQKQQNFDLSKVYDEVGDYPIIFTQQFTNVFA